MYNNNTPLKPIDYIDGNPLYLLTYARFQQTPPLAVGNG